ncbi:MAG: cupin domain-containing protein [Anaeromyxobacteraceae bacterium]
MPLDVKRLDVRRFDAGKMQKLNLFETPRFFCDVYCLEPGQAQKPHRHEGADKVYAVLAPAGLDHGVENAGPARAALLVFMAPRP